MKDASVAKNAHIPKLGEGGIRRQFFGIGDELPNPQ